MTPILSNLADWFSYLTEIDLVGANTVGKGTITLAQDSYFIMQAWRCYCTQDNPANFYQNNFTVQVTRGSSYQMMSAPVVQSMFGSSSYFAGKQWAWPILYSPLTNFDFTVQDLSGQATNSIFIGMEGYKVPTQNWSTFIRFFPELQDIYGANPPPVATS